MSTLQDGPKVVALTIDDGPSPVDTPQILRILRRYGITASFSMIGQSAAAFPGVAREVAAAGHMIVNHTWDHYNLGYMPAVAVQDEIAQATDAIHAATGERPRLFRAPYGVWPPAVFNYCAQAGLTPLAWSVDPRDWSRPGARAIVRDILSDTRTGSIILEHDGGGNRSQTVTALKIWLPRLLDKGYLFTTPLATTARPGPGPAKGRRQVVSAIQPHPILKLRGIQLSLAAPRRAIRMRQHIANRSAGTSGRGWPQSGLAGAAISARRKASLSYLGSSGGVRLSVAESS
jgi:peptidoglycan/xylan/chitin deacetylase (PgdA/CDA1 family)